MLQLDPVSRLSLADCVGHSWMKGSASTAAEVRLEFANRSKQIASKNNTSATEKAKSPKPTTAKTARRIHVRRGIDSGAED